MYVETSSDDHNDPDGADVCSEEINLCYEMCRGDLVMGKSPSKGCASLLEMCSPSKINIQILNLERF